MALLQEALVVTHQQLRLELLHRLERHAHRDEDRRPPNGNWLIPQTREHDRRDQRDGGQVDRARQRDPREDVVQVLRGRRPGRMPGMNPPCLRMLSAVSTGLNAIAV